MVSIAADLEPLLLSPFSQVAEMAGKGMFHTQTKLFQTLSAPGWRDGGDGGGGEHEMHAQLEFSLLPFFTHPQDEGRGGPFLF